MSRLGILNVPISDLLQWLGLANSVHVVHIYMDDDRSRFRVVVGDDALSEFTGVPVQQPERFLFNRLPTVTTGQLTRRDR